MSDPAFLLTLLRHLDEDDGRAAQLYLRLRSRLQRKFEIARCPDPEAAVSQTLDTVARRLHQGESIRNVQAYASGVAYFVLQEIRRRERRLVPLPDVLQETRRGNPEEQAIENELRELVARCLDELDADRRRLLEDYDAAVPGRKAKEVRANMAGGQGGRNKQAVRVFRARQKVKDCVQRQLMQRSLEAGERPRNR